MKEGTGCRMRLLTWWLQAWYSPRVRWWLWPLWPASWLVARIARRRYQQFRDRPPSPAPVPVLVVGNLTVGGVGKTPLVAALARHMQQRGYKPGIISRGYGRKARADCCQVTATCDPHVCGDEPVMLARQTGVPVVVGARRRQALELLLSTTSCDLVISDDGLQHYGLPRALEIVVVDSARLFGNGLCLPAGPLREPLARLAHVDWIVYKGPVPADAPRHSSVAMTLRPGRLLPVAAGAHKARPPQAGTAVSALAGIGHPQPFFDSLVQRGFDVRCCPFPDHHSFVPEELEALGPAPLIMTAKDAVKCRPFARDNWWYLELDVLLPDTFWTRLEQQLASIVSASHCRLNRLKDGQETA